MCSQFNELSDVQQNEVDAKIGRLIREMCSQQNGRRVSCVINSEFDSVANVDGCDYPADNLLWAIRRAAGEMP